MDLKPKILASILLSVVLCYFCVAPLAEGSAMQMTWGTPMLINKYIVVGPNDEVPLGNYSYVFQEQSTDGKIVPKADWERMISGDLSQLADQIRTQIPGAEPVWISVSWKEVLYDTTVVPRYIVSGLRVEAMVKNKGAGLTGIEIVAIIMAVALLVAVVTLCLTGTYSVWTILDATKQIGPWMTVIVGLIILVGIGFLLFTFLGGRAEYKGKKRSLRVGPK